MHLTLIQPAMGHGDRPYVRSWQMQPLSIAALRGLVPDGHEVAFYDDRFEPIPYDAPTDLVAITAESYTAKRAYQIAREFRRRGVRVVLGGCHPTLVSDEAARFADAIVVGDAEPVFPTLLADASKGQLLPRYVAPASCPGAMTSKLDRSVFAGKRYLPLGLVEAGRGCRFTCDFCTVTAYAKATYRHRPAAEVVRDIETCGSKNVFLVDDNLTADPARAKELVRALIPLKIRWLSQASIHVADDPELLDLLEKSGCEGLLIGFESIDKDTLRAMNKSFNRAEGHYGGAVARLRDHGLKLYATFVFGYDSEPPDVYERTLDFALEQRFFIAAFNHLQPFPGTPLYARLEREGRLLYKAWWLEPGYHFGRLAFRPATMSPEALYEKLMGLRRRYFSWSSILSRATDLKANARSLRALSMHFALNGMLRKELDEKWVTPLGDPRAGDPEPAAASEPADAASGS